MSQRELATQVHLDIAKLLELGVNEKIINELTEQEIRDLLKGLLYICEKLSVAEREMH